MDRADGGLEAGDEAARYLVRLYWRDLSAPEIQISATETRLQGQSSQGAIRSLSPQVPDPQVPDSQVVVQEWHNVIVREFLEVDIPAVSESHASTPRPILCGIEMVLERGKAGGIDN